MRCWELHINNAAVNMLKTGIPRINSSKLNMDFGLGMHHGIITSRRRSQGKVSGSACRCQSQRESMQREEDHGDVTYPSL